MGIKKYSVNYIFMFPIIVHMKFLNKKFSYILIDLS